MGGLGAGGAALGPAMMLHKDSCIAKSNNCLILHSNTEVKQNKNWRKETSELEMMLSSCLVTEKYHMKLC